VTTHNHRLTQLSPEIIYSDGGYFAADASIVAMLKTQAASAPRRRCRLCFHANSDAAQQEMLIVMHNSSYVRPHRHIGKLETLMVIEGTADTLLFDETGRVTETSAMSSPDGGGHFFYRMPDQLYHSLIFRSEWFVFLETTIGPFDRAMTEVAEWAPPETGMATGNAYLRSLPLP
jgi:cupin fold WbuC family metalloprotein